MRRTSAIVALMLFLPLFGCGETTVTAPPQPDVAEDAPEAGVAEVAEPAPDVADDTASTETLPEVVNPTDVAEPEPEVVPEDADAEADVGDAFVPTDGACEPDCADKACGSDGCGGICGYCTYPLVCDADGICVEVCEPQCDGKSCGPDGCGGACDPGCVEELICGEDGLCYEPTCEPDCTGKVCGDDGCGSDCGLCASPKVCLNGGCALGPCGTVDHVGECQGEVAVTCVDLVNLVEDDCDAYDDKECGYDAWDNQFACVEIGPCVPQCDGKVCGNDGCEGSCGACTNGWACELGQCKPEPGGDCGPITNIGQCEGTVLIFCSADKIYMVDCASTGESCKWDPPANAFGCL